MSRFSLFLQPFSFTENCWKEAGKFFKVLVVTIGQRDATAVQVELAPLKLWKLMKDPDAAGKTLTDEAAGDATPD